MSFMLDFSVQYDLWNQLELFFFLPRLWTSSFFGADHKVDQTMDHRNIQRLTIFDGYDAQKSDSHEYFRFLRFLVNEIRFSFGPRPRQ